MNAPTAATLLQSLALEFMGRYPDDAAVALQDLDADDAAALVAVAPPRDAASVLARLGPDIASRLLKRLPADRSRSVMANADPAVATALLHRLPHDLDPRTLLEGLPPSRRRELETYLSYPEDSAGSMMDPTAPVFRDDTRTGDVAASLRESRRYGHEVVIVTDQAGRLRGTLPTIEALLAPPDDRLASLAIRPTPYLEAFASRDDVVEVLERQRLAAMPVVDLDGRPLGALTQRALARVAEQDVTADMQTMVGASRDERALSSVTFAVRKRLP